MANTKKPIFAVGKSTSIAPAIASGILTYPSYIVCTDNDTLAFVDKDLSIRNIKGYNQEAIIYVDTLPTEDIRTDAFYICNGTGYLYEDSEYIPIFQSISASASYDSLNNIPIINKYGTISDIICLFDLDDGNYTVTGQYRVTDGELIHLTTHRLMFVINSDDNYKYITKIDGDELLLYTVDKETEEVTSAKYVTELYVEDSINGLYEKILEVLANTKVSYFENDIGYITDDDVKEIIATDEEVEEMLEDVFDN